MTASHLHSTVHCWQWMHVFYKRKWSLLISLYKYTACVLPYLLLFFRDTAYWAGSVKMNCCYFMQAVQTKGMQNVERKYLDVSNSNFSNHPLINDNTSSNYMKRNKDSWKDSQFTSR